MPRSSLVTNTLAGGVSGLAPVASESGLQWWFKGDAGLTLSGSSVTAWADQGGSGHDLSQGTTALQPTNPGTLNGLAYTRFTHTAPSWLASASWSLPTLTNFWLFLVLRPTTYPSTAGIVYHGNATDRWYLQQNGTSGVQGFVADSAGPNTDAPNSTTASQPSLSAWHYLTISATNTVYSFWYDGAAVTLNSSARTAQPVSSGNPLYLGRLFGTPTTSVGGGDFDLAEIFFYTNDQSANRTQRELYLKSRWGL